MKLQSKSGGRGSGSGMKKYVVTVGIFAEEDWFGSAASSICLHVRYGKTIMQRKVIQLSRKGIAGNVDLPL